MKRILLITISCFMVFACKDDDKIFEPQQESQLGGLVRFVNAPRPATIAADDPTNFTFSEPVEDPNNNVVEYSLAVRNAAGDYMDLGVNLTSFPTDLVLTADMIANALGVDASSFNFGDTFVFRGTLTNEAGIVYSGVPQNFDPQTGEVTGGNTDLTNIGDLSNNYRMRFSLHSP